MTYLIELAYYAFLLLALSLCHGIMYMLWLVTCVFELFGAHGLSSTTFSYVAVWDQWIDDVLEELINLR